MNLPFARRRSRVSCPTPELLEASGVGLMANRPPGTMLGATVTEPTPLPQPSPSSCKRALRELEKRLGPSKVQSELGTREAFVTDDSGAPGLLPDAVVLAETRDDIISTLAV